MANTLKIKLRWEWNWYLAAAAPWIKITGTPAGKTDETVLLDWQKALPDTAPVKADAALSAEGMLIGKNPDKTKKTQIGQILIGLGEEWRAGAKFHKWMVDAKEKATTPEEAEEKAQASPKKHEVDLAAKGIGTTVDAATEKAKRDALVALFNYWLKQETTILKPYKPMKADGTTQEPADLLELAGWSLNPATENQKVWTPPGNPTLKIDAGVNLESLKGQFPPAAWTQDKAGGAITCVGMGNRSAAIKAYNLLQTNTWTTMTAAFKADPTKPDPGTKPIPVAMDTSCLAVMGRLMSLWGSTYQIDLNSMVNVDPLNYVKSSDAMQGADKSKWTYPKPGDILFLCQGNKRNDVFAHTCFLVSTTDTVWTTCDGGGGSIPDQSAIQVPKTLAWSQDATPLPMINSTTDKNLKTLHGWVDLSKVPNSKYK